MLNLSSNVTAVLGRFAKLSGQFRFTVAKALTDTARDVARVMPARVEADLDKPTPFTKRGFYSQPANKQSLTAIVGVKDIQAQYLRWQVEGGVRQPERKRLKLPSQITVDVYGNIPRGVVRQLVRRAEAGKGVTNSLAVRVGVSREAGLFYGKPKGKGQALPAGIWKREAGRITPVVVFPEQPARYRRRFDFEGHAAREARRVFPEHLRAAWRLAQATAR